MGGGARRGVVCKVGRQHIEVIGTGEQRGQGYGYEAGQHGWA